jgi:carbamoyltransferase
MNKNTYILSFKPAGTLTIPDVHDPSAVLCKNGKIVAGVEEERLNRIKHSVDCFPFNSIRYCLDHENVNLSDLEKIIIPDDPELFKKDAYGFWNLKRIGYKRYIKKHYKNECGTLNPVSYYVLKEKAMRQRILLFLKSYFGDQEYPNLEFMGHHLSHAASCFFPSGFNNAAILSIDGVGDFDSTVIWSYDDEDFHREYTCKLDNSLGYFYGAFTVLLGFRFCNGESKVMGLAPYGEKNKDIFNVFDEIIKTDLEGYDVSEISIPMIYGTEVAVKRIEDLFGIKRRLSTQPFTKDHKDLAYALQFYLEKISLNLVKQAIDLTGESNVCLSGGVTLNCKMNKKIMELDQVKDLFIQPVAHDAGLAIGAALYQSSKLGFDVKFKMKHNYFGPCYDAKIIEDTLNQRKIRYSKVNSLKQIANAIANGKFIGWFQGNMEMGPRALGNRSILCDPRREDLKDKLNEFVKHREKWRPYAPSILEEYADDFIENYKVSSLFMIKTFDVKQKHINSIKGVLHPKDLTTRPHVVNKDVNPNYYELIDEFRKLTGVPLVLNTSFNDHGEPIVCTPHDAVEVFYSTGLDILVMDKYMIEK